MNKTKKLLSVFLAVLMIMSFTPLFASAASITLNTTNVIILEAPKITYGDQVEVNKVTVNYGVTPKDLTVTGGKLGYVASEGATPVEIPGTFSATSTVKLAVGDDVTIPIKFTPDDTATYSSPTIRDTFTMAEGVTWNSARVIGIATTLVEMPTPKTTFLGIGNTLTSGAKLSGGKVVDADGNEVSGTWSYVNNRTMDTEGVFEEDIQWKKTGYEPIFAKVTITVKYFETSVAELPTAAVIQYTNSLSNATLTGGKVVDENGNDVTSAGKWKYVTPSFIPEQSGEYDIEWTATGFKTITTKVYVEVQADATSLVEGPEPRYVRTSAFLFDEGDDIKFKDGSGKVVDKDGNDITSLGKWSGVADGKTIICKDTEIDVKWEALGYAPVYAKMTVLVNPQYSTNITLSNVPEFKYDSLNVIYQPDKYLSDYVSVIPGELIDDNGNVIEGTWSYKINGYGSIKPEAQKAIVSSFIMIQTFTPNDSSLPKLEQLIKNVTLTVSKSNFQIIDDFEIVLNYGASFTGSLKSSALTFSNVGTVPEAAGINSIQWSKSVFDPSTADYGSVTMVNVTIQPNDSNYNNLTVTVPVRIQNYTMELFANWSDISAYSRGEDNVNGIINYSVDFSNSRLFGTVSVSASDGTDTWEIDTITPTTDENGKSVYKKQGTWQAPHDGDYTLSYTYNPNDSDTATILNPVMNHTAVSVDIKEYRTLTIKIGSQTITEQIREDAKDIFYWANLTDASSDDFEYWELKDPQGNSVTWDGFDATDYNLKIQMPEHDLIVTAKGAIENTIIIDGEQGLLATIVAFFNKLIAWITNIVSNILNFWNT